MSSPEYTPKQIADDRYNNDSQELELVWFAVRLKLEKFYGLKSSADEIQGGVMNETWYAKPTGCGGQALVISEADGRNVAVAYEEKDGPLLAASPELLDALKTFPMLLGVSLTPWGRRIQDWQETALAAIAKAEGKE